jgi:D-lactate dehydrogenase (cytochrome)
MRESFHDYLKDESKLLGEAESISFPESEAEIGKVLQLMRESRTPVTIQGGKTGIVGGAVPLRGHIMNLSHMKRVKSFSMGQDGEASLTVEPGVTLKDLRKAIQRLEAPKVFFWPPDPSELTATVGGIAATNAKGICCRHYGNTASFIPGIRVMNAKGMVRDVKRGQNTLVVNGKPRDLLDVYLGSEGMFGAITEITLRLLPKPLELWGIGFFFETADNGMSFADKLNDMSFQTRGAHIAAIEYLDPTTTINALAAHHSPRVKSPHGAGTDAHRRAMVYVEIHGEQEKAIEKIAQTLMVDASKFNSDPDKTWAFSGETEIDRVKNFLYTADLTAISHIEKTRCVDSRITKLGLDFSLACNGLKTLVTRLENKLQKENLKACFRGHMGSSLHADILPESYEEFVKGKAFLETWAEKHPDSFGSAITSYGIGKLKRSIFLKTLSPACLSDIIQLKKQLDQERLWNPGNMI